MNFIGLLRTLEAMTRPPRLGHDDDRPLPDYEPVSPDGYYGYAEPDLGADTEPGLTSDELVGVRGILQERYNPNFAGAAASLADERFIQPSAGVSSFGSSSVREDKQQDEVTCLASVKSPADPHITSPPPTIVQSAPPPTVDGGAGGGGALHSPGARLPHPASPTSTLLTNGAHAIELWLTGSEPNTFAREAWEQVAVELRDRAATFEDIEQDK